VKIEWETHLFGMPVVDQDGHRLGRIAAAYCTPDPDTAVWFVVRLPGLRGRWRAVPAQQAHWDDSVRTSVCVPYRRELVLASPVVDENSLDTAGCRDEVELFYASVAAEPIPR
jgi:hypothetical protein